jgi:hypothetical protein
LPEEEVEEKEDGSGPESSRWSRTLSPPLLRGLLLPRLMGVGPKTGTTTITTTKTFTGTTTRSGQDPERGNRYDDGDPPTQAREIFVIT